MRMKLTLKTIFTFWIVLMTFQSYSQSQIQLINPPNEFGFCGSTFKVYCDGTVDIDYASNVKRVKVFIGGTELLDFPEDGPINYDPFNTSELNDPFGNPLDLSVLGNIWIQVYTPCGIGELNIRDAVDRICVPVEGGCGATFEPDCENGAVIVNLPLDVTRYKVFIPGGTVLDFPDDAPIIYGGFSTAQFITIQPGENYWVQIYCRDGSVTNFSLRDLLSEYCSEYSNYRGIIPYQVYENEFNQSIRGGDDIEINSPIGYSKTIQQERLDRVNVFPNPAKELVNVSMPFSTTGYSIEVLNINGQILNQHVSQGGNLELDIENLVSGIYVIKIQSIDGLFHHAEKLKVIK